ncbi:hypothetical protein A0H81_04487 [Grifola frondosa]|uniref:Uncharacterized protein n=1 Tax=Grifola frondosa TaxID=5627 RepID=A0A1C7ME47_GRIFR|nr:hypothetical protein A0H81_04487 [Grifola frondosa]
MFSVDLSEQRLTHDQGNSDASEGEAQQIGGAEHPPRKHHTPQQASKNHTKKSHKTSHSHHLPPPADSDKTSEVSPPPAPKKFKRAREPEVPVPTLTTLMTILKYSPLLRRKFKYDQSLEEMLLKIRMRAATNGRSTRKAVFRTCLQRVGVSSFASTALLRAYDSWFSGLPSVLHRCVSTDLVTTVPDFKILIPYLQAHASRTLILSAFLDAHAGDIVPTFISDGNDKSNRSWKDASLARLLVPRKERDKFDNNPYLYMRRVREGIIPIMGYNYPSFMYDDSCFRNIFTGPRTANAKPGTGGKKGIAKKKSMRCVTPQNIAYIAVITRFAINSQCEWDEDDGSFNAVIFVESIMRLFRDEKWAAETLRWWNMQIFGHSGPDDDYNAEEMREDDELAIIEAQRASRHLQRTVSSSSLFLGGLASGRPERASDDNAEEFDHPVKKEYKGHGIQEEEDSSELSSADDDVE